jgi:YaiO family outer membrane protein
MKNHFFVNYMVCIACVVGQAYGSDEEKEILNPLTNQIVDTDPEDPTKNRIDLQTAYSYRSPVEDYGRIYEGIVTWTHQHTPNLSWIASLAMYSRLEGEGALLAATDYYNWTERMYTTTAIALGTNSSYLPRFRIDQFFNYKFREAKNFILQMGFTYIDFYEQRNTEALMPGFIYYGNKWIAAYNYFAVWNHPGNKTCSSHKGSLIIGEENKSWLTLDAFYGCDAYLLTNEVLPQGVDRTTWGGSVNYRKWTKNHWGFVVEGGFYYIEAPCRQYRLLLGIFRDLQ